MIGNNKSIKSQAKLTTAMYNIEKHNIKTISENFNMMIKKVIIPHFIKYQKSVELAIKQCKNNDKTRT